MQKVSWENYLKWVIEMCNQEYKGNMSNFNKAMLSMDK